MRQVPSLPVARGRPNGNLLYVLVQSRQNGLAARRFRKRLKGLEYVPGSWSGRRGSDVVKSLALGAKAVMLGRAYLWASPPVGRPARRMCSTSCAAESIPPSWDSDTPGCTT